LNKIWRNQTAAATAALTGFVVAFSFPVLRGLPRIGVVWDWPEALIRHWAAYRSLHDFHQLPLWNPYACGGMPLLAHPQSHIVTPMFALPLLFGPFVGLNLEIPAHLAVAWAGGYVLAAVLGMGMTGRLTCASIFPASSWFYLHLGVGHLNFLPSVYLPWVAALVLIGGRGRSLTPWALSGLVLAIMFGEGSVYQPTQAVFLAILIALGLAVTRKSLWPFVGLIIMGLFALGFGAIKLIPSWDLLRLHPRPIEDLDPSSVRTLLTGLFARSQFYDRLRVEPWGFWELGAYLSPAAALLAVLGLVTTPRRAVPWMLAATCFFVLAMGGTRPWFPWALLHPLPIFKQERMPERFLIVFVLLIGVIAGFGADFLAGWRKPLGAIVALLLLTVAMADAWIVSRPNMDAPVASEVEAVTPSPQFVQRFEDPWSQVTLARSNIGALHCNESLDYQDVDRMKVTAANQPGYRGEYYLLGPGELALRRWTPNALSFDVATPGPNVLVINQNYDANWRLTRGRGEVISHNGLLAVRVPAGGEELRLVFRSFLFLLGAGISLLTCAVAAGLWIRERRRARA